jgi:hypothetical protein
MLIVYAGKKKVRNAPLFVYRLCEKTNDVAPTLGACACLIK